MAYTREQLEGLVYQGLVDRGLENLWPIIREIVALESGWEPTAHNTQGEDSVGLFQLNRAGGVGAGYSVEQLKNPEFNIGTALDSIQNSIEAKVSPYDALQPWSTRDNAIAAAQGRVGTIEGGYGVPRPALPPQAEGTPAAAGGQSYSQFLEGKGFTPGQAIGEVSMLPTSVQESLWAEFTGQGAEAEGMTPYQQAEVLFRLLDERVKVGELSKEDAVEEYLRYIDKETAQRGRLSEAGQRAQQVQNILETRAYRTLPGKYVPGTRPEDVLAQSMAKRGLTFQPEEGVPASAFPDPWELFRQANLSVGLPGELEPFQPPAVPPTPNIRQQLLPGVEAGLGLGGGGQPGGGVTPQTAWGQFQAQAPQAAAATQGLFPFQPTGAMPPPPPAPPQPAGLSNDWLKNYLARTFGLQFPGMAVA